MRAAVNQVYAFAAQGLPCEGVDVGQVFAAAYAFKGVFGGGMQAAEGFAHVFADLESVRADGGAEVGHDFVGIGLHRGQRVLQDAACQSAPARMGGGHHRARAVAKQNGQAVCRHHCASRRARAVE